MFRFKILFYCSPLIISFACSTPTQPEEKPIIILKDEESEYNPMIGVGAFTSFEVPETIDTVLVSKGKLLYTEKCAVCHKLNDEVMTGPGWKEITDRRTAVWLMNYLTNTDEMLDTDPSLKELIIQYKTRMTNLNLSGEEARAILEFMRENDVEQSNIK